MIGRDAMETRFFSEGPKFCRQGAICLMGAGLVLSLLGALVKPDVPWVEHFGFAGLLAIPAGLLAILSLTIARRHVITVPIVLLLCVFVGRFLIVRPDAALEGMTTSPFSIAMSWIVFFALIAGVLAVAGFIISLWQKGAFK